MNQSSLFSFEESSVWDPKVIRKRLIVSPDQLTKLNLIPGWAKIQNNQDLLRLDKDFSIESSQPEYSINVTQNFKRIQSNTKLFNEQIENRKTILKAYKDYEKKLTRSLSSLIIDENHENSLNSKTLKRTSSLQNFCELFDNSVLNNPKDFECKNFSEKYFPSDLCNKNILLHTSVENTNLSSQCKISHLEPEEKVFLNKEANLETMELSHLPINIHTAVENATLQFETAKESNGILPTEKATGCSDQIAKHVNIESLNTDVHLHSEITDTSKAMLPVENESVILNEIDKFDQIIKNIEEFVSPNLHSETAKECNADDIELSSKTVKETNYAMPIAIVTPCLNNAPDEPVDLNSNNILYEKTDILISSENDTLVKENVVKNSDLNIELSDIDIKDEPRNCYYKNDATISIGKSNDLNLYESCLSKSFVEDILAAKIRKKVLETEQVVKNYVSIPNDKSNDLKLQKLRPSKSIIEDTPAENLSTSKVILETKQEVKNSCSNVEPSNIDIRSEPRESYYKSDAAILVAKSNDLNSYELCPSKSIAEDIPAAKLLTSKKVLETEYIVKNSGTDKQLNDEQNEPKECYKACDPCNNEASSSNKEASFSKKRKLDSRNKRSKRLKSEEGNLKIRSIKKTGEICYSAEEVKSMLDILKQLL